VGRANFVLPTLFHVEQFNCSILKGVVPVPTGVVLKRMLEREIDDTLDNATALDYFNAGLRDLALVARKNTKTSISIFNTDRSAVLPSIFAKVNSVAITLDSYPNRVFTMADLASYGFEVYGDPGDFSILWARDLPSSGSLEVRGIRYPNEMAAVTETPELPDFAHDALYLYGAMKYLEADDELPAAAARKVEYQVKKMELDDFTTAAATSSQPLIMDARPPWLRR
jgi:hypothetical protein